MAKIRVVAKRDFIESITTSSRPLPALSELIWNGLDASANRISVKLARNELGTVDSISVTDDGTGIEHSQVEKLFGDLGDSWKKTRGKYKGRALHGKNGRGRFKAFALGERVEWDTVFLCNEHFYTFRVVGNTNTLDDFEVSEPSECKTSTTTGTTVTISNPPRNLRSLQSENITHELAKIFCAYLTEYPFVSVEYDGQKVDPADAQLDKSDYDLNNVVLSNGSTVNAKLSIIEWKVSTERTIHLCDESGVSLHETSLGQKIRAPGYSFTVYVKSIYFKELDQSNLLAITDLHENAMRVVDAATDIVKVHFRQKIAKEQSAVVKAWKRENIYPYKEKEDIGPVEVAERQMFDILAVNVQSYLPSFEKTDIKSKKFTFLLLAQALKQNPESLQTIIGEILELKRETQDDLADLLKKTSLSSIISSSKVVANRLDFLNGLEILLFNKESKKKLLERDQLHKILEKEAWIFHEEFSLAGSEERLEEVLRKHLEKLGIREDAPESVNVGEGGGGRIDLMLHKAAQPRAGEYDYLVVELKRPNQKINSDVLTQIEKYAIAVANDERFHGIKVRWTFMAISNELDEFAKRRARQRGKPPGVVFDDDELNITVWAKSWADVINDSRAKLSFVNKQLEYEAGNASAKEYLQSAHSKYIPEVATFASEATMEEAAFENG